MLLDLFLGKSVEGDFNGFSFIIEDHGKNIHLVRKGKYKRISTPLSIILIAGNELIMQDTAIDARILIKKSSNNKDVSFVFIAAPATPIRNLININKNNVSGGVMKTQNIKTPFGKG